MEVKKIAAHGSNYTKGRKQAVRYIVVHYTANDGDMAENNGKYFSRENRGASAHYFVDEKEVVESVAVEDIAWHCGAKRYHHETCRNENSIGVEMCSEKDEKGQYYINEATQQKAVEVIRWLMGKYGVGVENVLRHYDVTGKICPEPFVRNQVAWLDFKGKLTDRKEETEMLYNYVDENMPAWARPTIEKLVKKGALKGNEKGELMLTDVMLRVFVVNDKMGVYGE